MKAARLHSTGLPLIVEDVPTPEPGPGQVLIRIKGAGFCHSDVHVLEADASTRPNLPAILGHENAGVVEQVGHGVTSVARGEPVIVFGGWGCERCDYCVSGDVQHCVTPTWGGLSAHAGGYAEYMLVPDARYLVHLDRLDPASSAPLADAGLTPYRAVRRALPYIQPDHAVLVIGVGGLGQHGIKLLRIFGGAPIIAVDLDPRKRALALEYGAAYALDPADPEIKEQIKSISRGGVSAAFDFVGIDPTLDLALTTARTGGKVTQVGVGGGTAQLRLGLTRFEVTFETTLWGNVKELRELIALAESGVLTSIPIEFAPLADINQVYERLKKGDVEGRAVITP